MHNTMNRRVRVSTRGRAYDLDRLRPWLRLNDLPAVQRQRAPAIWVDGRLHHEATAWLEVRHATVRSPATLKTNAERLAAWIDYLRGRGRTVHSSSEEDYRAYEASSRFPTEIDHPELIPVSDNWWRVTKSTIKQFHEWLERTHGTPVPFTLVDKPSPRGGTVRGIDDAGRLRSSSPDVLPLLPEALAQIVKAATRPTPSGRERGQSNRDVALIQFLVATGMRVTPATHLTHYEVPPPSGGDFDWVHTPAAINKNKRAVRSGAFAARLRPLRNYVAGDRSVLRSHGLEHEPEDPLLIHEATPRHVTYITRARTVVRRRWDDVDARHRFRLVDVDGSSPLLWLTQTGAPLCTRTAQHIVKEAVKAAAARDDATPADAHPHSLRHTYATYMAVMWMTRDPDLYPSGAHRIRFGLMDAVRHVQRELGHVDERTTTIYVTHVRNLLGVDPVLLKGSS